MGQLSEGSFVTFATKLAYRSISHCVGTTTAATTTKSTASLSARKGEIKARANNVSKYIHMTCFIFNSIQSRSIHEIRHIFYLNFFFLYKHLIFRFFYLNCTLKTTLLKTTLLKKKIKINRSLYIKYDEIRVIDQQCVTPEIHLRR